MPPPEPPRPRPRPPNVPANARPTTTGDYTVYVVGDQRGAVLRDLYHTFLRVRWSWSLAILSVGFVAVNLVFAIAYLIVGGVGGVRDGSFIDALSFSVQTLATIGYGVMHPQSNAATAVMIVEAMVGIIITALATGLVFAKFSRATTRVAFSRYAVITQHDGVLTLMFRLGNRRSNTIVDAQIHVVATKRTVTKEGAMFYKSFDLRLARDRLVGMTRGWNVFHVIDADSPLHGLDAAALADDEVELAISLTGIDSVSTQQVHTVHQYGDADIKIGYKLADTLTPLPGGDLMVDLRQFDVIVPDDARDSVAP